MSKMGAAELGEHSADEPIFKSPFEEDKEAVYESSFEEQNVDDDYHEDIRKATSVRIDKLQSMMRSKHDMYHVLHAMSKLNILFIISIL